MKLFKCQHCAQLLYFENNRCERCSRRLGYLPEIATLSALEPEGDAWSALAMPGKLFRFCANAQYDACNWMVDAAGPELYCAACRHNRMIPDASIQTNLQAWRKIEVAKHRLFYTLMRLNLPLEDRNADNSIRLVFDFLASPPIAGAAKVMTGHEHGLITLAVEEADDAEREKRRAAMGEPYRTLLGHFRHEVGHYFWDLLVLEGGKVQQFRDLFGDERAPYDQALQNHYAHGAPPQWQENFVSAYATSHPWEDFAETWAHYLHIVDTLEMGWAFGIYLHPAIATGSELDAAVDFDPYRMGRAEPLINAWIPLSNALNCFSRTMGQSDLYPFIISPAVVRKLSFIHDLIHGWLVPAQAEEGAVSNDNSPDTSTAPESRRESSNR